MLKLSHELATIQTDVPIEADLSSLVLPNYEPQIFKEMEESGYTLIAKHARSLYSLI
ncbi:hypothetical protein OL548_31945 [Lysinibacillus sp. MHQ-1]|nr:hypothetical protein OL548_31945 [Lysinibacillus sp. MHQ-1]